MIANLWRKIILGQVTGLYISNEKNILYSPYLNNEALALGAVKGDWESIVPKVISTSTSKFRSKFKKWPMLKYLVCLENPSYDIGMKCFKNLHKDYNLILYSVSPEICLAIGSGEEITDNKKRVFINLTKNEINGFLVFAAGVFARVTFQYQSFSSIDIAINNAISEVITRSLNEIPEVLALPNLDVSEIEEYQKGWNADLIASIVIISSNLELNPQIESYKSVKYELKKCYEHYEYIHIGMKGLVENSQYLIK